MRKLHARVLLAANLPIPWTPGEPGLYVVRSDSLFRRVMTDTGARSFPSTSCPARQYWS